MEVGDYLHGHHSSSEAEAIAQVNAATETLWHQWFDEYERVHQVTAERPEPPVMVAITDQPTVPRLIRIRRRPDSKKPP